MFNKGTWTLAGTCFGVFGTLSGLALFSLLDFPFWAMHVFQISAGIGFRVLVAWDYGCFPTNVNATALNALLAISGGLQWGAVGFLLDLMRARKNPAAH